MAPATPGAALLDAGPGGVGRLIPSDRADATSLFRGDAPSAALASALRAHDHAFAYTRNAAVSASLADLIPRVVVHDPEPAPGSGHASQWLARPLESLGLSAAELPPSYRLGPDEERLGGELCSELPDRFLAVHPGSGSAAKNWPVERFAALVEAMARGETWLLVEGPADAASVAALRVLPGAVLARDRPPRALGALLGRAGLYVGNDSGVTHLAAAWGAPTLGLFGPTDPAVWGPVGERATSVASRNRRMDGLELAEVIAAATSLKAPTGSRAGGPPAPRP
jgi:ADP-heptose:LPS heptosyltransferase